MGEAAVEELPAKAARCGGLKPAGQHLPPRRHPAAGVYSMRRPGTQPLSGAWEPKPSVGLAKSLLSLGFEVDRFKTGTPPRVYKRSINFDGLATVDGEQNVGSFSYTTGNKEFKQVSCYLTYTNEKTHRLILDNINYAPIYSGLIRGKGPRYCPSIEDKIVRFADRERHPIFIDLR